jgi:hypothetical protein
MSNASLRSARDVLAFAARRGDATAWRSGDPLLV